MSDTENKNSAEPPGKTDTATAQSNLRRIEAVIRQLDDAIIGIDDNGIILFVNAVAKAILNAGNDPIEGKTVNGLCSCNPLFRSIISGEIESKPHKTVINGKELFFQLISRGPIVSSVDMPIAESTANENQPAGRVYILRDITEFLEKEEAKTNFIAIISHELKTPMASIKMSLQLLNNDRVGIMNNEQRRLLNQIEEDNNRLLKITGELLVLSQAETGKIHLSIVQADPIQIINCAIAAVKFQSAQKQVTLDAKCDKGLPKVKADIEKCSWVLVNFISNALRYSHKGSKVIIAAKLRLQMVEFSVKDFGRGIDEQYQQRVFEKYFQVPADEQNSSGSGLGLAISKDFIEAQQGEIGVESALGKGSLFYFRLPVLKS